MIDAKDLLWNDLVSLKDKPELVKAMNSADCAWQKTLEILRDAPPGLQIVVTGIQNSGKSTLCNLLVEDYDNRTFEIGDREVTLEVKRGKIPKTGANILDTPGFGTAAARGAGFEQLWANADVLIFATSILSGSISDHAEVKGSLERIINSSPDLANRICVVCTKMSDSENAEEIYEKDRAAAKEILGDKAPVFMVDSHWYQDAVKSDDRDLAQVSGIPPFLAWVEQTSALPSRRENIFENAKREWLANLDKARKTIESSISGLRKKKENLITSLFSRWGDLRPHLRSAWEQCKRYAR